MNKIIFPLAPGAKGPAVADLQDALQLCIDHNIVSAPRDPAGMRELSALLKRERAEQNFGNATAKLVGLFQTTQRLPTSGAVDGSTATALNALLKQWGVIVDADPPIPNPNPTGSYQVTGRVASRTSAGTNGLRVSIVDKGVGADVPLAETITDARGSFQVSFAETAAHQRGKTQLDLQARVFAGTVFLGASEVRYNAKLSETLNVLLDDRASAQLRSEHEVLTGAIGTQFKGRLADLQETDTQQDITYLANKTGWDARAVALAALADQFSARSAGPAGATSIPAECFYALFRGGIAANEDTLYRTDTDTMERILRSAATQGIISKTSAEQIPVVLRRLEGLSAQKLLSAPALIGASSLKEMLVVAGLTDAQQATFAQLSAAHRTDLPTFWKSVGDAFGATLTQRLQVDGKLGFLTVNNAPLMKKLHASVRAGLTDLVQLAQLDYFHPATWSKLLTADVPVPKEIPGDTPQAKLQNYASYLAAQIRLSYPTVCVAQMVKSGELPLPGAPTDAANQVSAFLLGQQGKFELGTQPVQRYLAQNKLSVAAETVRQVKRLQRVFQITPSDQALTGLMKRGVDSAHHVIRFGKDTFVRSFASDVGGSDQAALIYDKATQVHHVVLNLALGYLNARTAAPIGVHSPPSVLDPVPADTGDVSATPSLETLFGSMDFCTCDHCRSILSPAAYLVDLLQFLQSDQDVWTAFAATWKSEHGNAPYPFVDQTAWQQFQTDWNTNNSGKPVPNTELSPYDVLISRRPDLENLPLTCENTNTALPYIDVVNETLEYFVANNSQQFSLSGYAGHDTADADSADLLASPQFVMDSAYTLLRQQRFPLALPFHQPLEQLRRHFSKFEVPLPQAMEQLRQTDALERGANTYAWRDILMEEIGCSREEYETLTDSTAVPLWRMYGFPSGTTDAAVIAGLSNVSDFTHRLDLAYTDLVAILQSRFINPDSDLIPKLERLGVSFGALQALKNGTLSDSAFDALLPTALIAPDPTEYGGDIKAWVKNDANYARIMGLIVLSIPAAAWTAAKACVAGACVRPSAPTAGSTLYYECVTGGTTGAAEPSWPTLPGSTCTDGTVVWICRDVAGTTSFSNLAFAYSDPAKFGQAVSAAVFVRLLRFIRLWKRLGWTIEQTDAALCACYRADFALPSAADLDTPAKLDAGFLLLLPRIGLIARVRRELNLNLKRDLFPLLACWTNINTSGEHALYRTMFLTPTLLQQDAVFADNGYGEFLGNASLKLAPHAEALRSAFNLSGDEYALIIAELGFDDTTALTISNLSAIFRRGWLARKLKLSVRELLLLIQLTGLNPFTTSPAIVRLIQLVHAMKDRSLKSASALYLFWNQDLSGKSAPKPEAIAAFARTLRLALSNVATDFAIGDDPDGVIAQTRMATIYGNDAASFFFGLLNDTLTTDVDFSDPDATLASDALRTAIETAAGQSASGSPKIAYDDFRKRLSYSGVLTTTARDAIKLASGAGAAALKAAVDALYTENLASITPFFARYAELRPSFDAYVADTVNPVAVKRTQLIQSLMPELIARKKQQQALQAVASAVNTDLAFAQIFLAPAAGAMPLHAANQNTQPALNDLLALETAGLSVRFFAGDTVAGVPLAAPAIAADLDYAPTATGSTNPLPTNPTPGAAVSGIWTGRLEIPENGFFNVRITVDAGASVTLVLNDAPVVLQQNAGSWSNSTAVEVQAGTLCAIQLTVEKVRDRLRVEWEWTPKGQGRSVIPPENLYPAEIFAAFQTTYVRFLKIASLANGVGLTASELAFLGRQTAYQVNGDAWLNALAVQGDPTPTVAAALLTPFEALLEFARIKAEISPDDESLLTCLKDPAAATATSDSLLFTLTRWDPTSLTVMLTRFGAAIPALSDFEMFRRAYNALALAQKMRLSATALINATTNAPTGDTVRDLQAALRARYDAADWRDVVRPINDEMRSLQRDALVACILHQMRSHPESAHVDTPDKLFEYFLMDVQMEPVMQTSRIRHALSSVQLFVERCLMNLEKRVSPAAINAKQWEWMKRYRVWEANRKVYLFPENWLEPELRDDKSPFFKEIESELLQSDLTDDSAATALINYLSKLEEVAKLQPCGIFHIPADAAKRTGEIDHVVARTAGAHRKYYYRRREYGYWTPWEQIKLEIEDNPIIPVVWNDRLFIFWIRLVKTSSGTSAASGKATYWDAVNNTAPANPQLTVQAILCWSEYYNGKWQVAKTSDVAKPTTIGNFDLHGFDRSKLRLRSQDLGETLRILVQFPGVGSSYFDVYNTHSLPVRKEDIPSGGFVLDLWRSDRDISATSDPLEITYWHSMLAKVTVDAKRDLLKTSSPLTPTVPLQDLAQPWEAPFFLEDRRHVFYVNTTKEPVWIPTNLHFGIPPHAVVSPAAKVPPLVLAQDPNTFVKPKLWGDGGPPNVTIDPAPIERFVTEDAYIRQGIGATGVVTFGNKQIGPGGAQLDSIGN